MERVISATEARIRFGEVMRRAVEGREPIIVKRSGKPYVVMLSVEGYNRLRKGQAGERWQETLEQILQLSTRIRDQRGGKPLPLPEEMIREAREERDAQLTHLR